MNDLKQKISSLNSSYSKFKMDIGDITLKHNKLIHEIADLKYVEVESLGYSIENREIFLLKIGTGKRKILAWSQMHGDEPTATLAILDIINYLEKTIEDEETRYLLANVTIYIIPMLNPDGAEKNKRENSINIDINRDALKLECPESKILHEAFLSLKPDFGFNLHDQSSHYTTGRSGKSATLSFLSPPYNYSNSINGVRKNAMKLIAHIANSMYEIIPNQIGRYSDEFEPRAFGDNFTKAGSSIILVESGGSNSIQNKEFVRKLNFISLLSFFHSIAFNDFTETNLNRYFEIPENRELKFDLLLRNADLYKMGEKYKIDIGINFSNFENQSVGIIEEIGDLSTYFAHEILDCNGCEVTSGKVYNTSNLEEEKLKNLDLDNLIQKGYTDIFVNAVNRESLINESLLCITSNEKYENSISPRSNANLIIKTNSSIKYVIIQGKIIRLHQM